jgi:hypothetical protein
MHEGQCTIDKVSGIFAEISLILIIKNNVAALQKNWNADTSASSVQVTLILRLLRLSSVTEAQHKFYGLALIWKIDINQIISALLKILKLVLSIFKQQ